MIWGNHRVGGGQIRAAANAWRNDVAWGSGLTPEGQLVAWGVACAATTGPRADDSSCDTVSWTTATDGATAPGTGSDNVVWGTQCGGADCDDVVWGSVCDADECAPLTMPGGGASSVLATRHGLWGTAEPGDTIAWGTAGDAEDHAVVRVTDAIDDSDNIVWGAPAFRRESRLPITDSALR
jgi:hypothetical protein